MKDAADENIICLFRENKREEAFRLLVNEYKERLCGRVSSVMKTRMTFFKMCL